MLLHCLQLSPIWQPFPSGVIVTVFQDVHVMMFIGIGYLMTFMRRYSFSSVGFNFLVGAFVIQWSTLMQGFLHLHDGKIQVNIVR